MEIPSTLEFIKKLQMDLREATYDSEDETRAQNIISEVYCPEIIKALEKQIQKKPKFDRNLNDLRSVYICECGKEIICLHGSGIFKNVISQKFCPECGQAIGFGEGE